MRAVERRVAPAEHVEVDAVQDEDLHAAEPMRALRDGAYAISRSSSRAHLVRRVARLDDAGRRRRAGRG